MALSESNWFRSWFGKDYLKVYAHRDQEDANRLVQLILSQISLSQTFRILDIGCGQGRHLSVFAQKQLQITGIDLSLVLLKIAKKNNINNSHINFIQADMRRLPLNATFDLILNLFTSFGYFEHDKENKMVLYQIARLLKKSGHFVLDYFNSDYVKANLIPRHKKKIGKLIIEQQRYIENSRIKKKINFIKNGRTSTYLESVKLYSPEEIFKMFGSLNLKIKKTFGNYDGSDFHKHSPRIIVIGEKFE